MAVAACRALDADRLPGPRRRPRSSRTTSCFRSPTREPASSSAMRSSPATNPTRRSRIRSRTPATSSSSVTPRTTRDVGDVRAFPDAGYPLDVPGIYELRGVLPPISLLSDAASGLGHNRFLLDPDGPLRHTVPFVRTHQRVLPSLGAAAAFRVAGISPSDVRLDGTLLRYGDRVVTPLRGGT